MERPKSAFACFFLLLATLTSAQQLFAGSGCSTTGGLSGVCKSIESCPAAKEDLSNGNMPTLCSFNLTTPLVCCPPSATSSKNEEVGQIARKMCERYASAAWREVSVISLDHSAQHRKINVSQCGAHLPTPIITLPSLYAVPTEFPHMAAIGFGDEEDIVWQCGGSLISERYVLTSANCAHTRNRGLARWVRLGDVGDSPSGDKGRAQQFSVVKFIRHPDFSAPSRYNDIALLKLNTSVEMNAYVRPACLNVDRNITEKFFLASGWEHDDWKLRLGNLIKLRLSALPQTECNKAYQPRIPIQDDKMICTWMNDDGKDLCQVDSGSPLQLLLEQPYCMYSVVGVSSFGFTLCYSQRTPAVHTRVSHYIPWIESIVWPS